MIETESTTWKLSEIGRQKLLDEGNDLEPEIELVLRVVGMMDKPTTRQNIISIINQLIEDFGGVDEAIEAIKYDKVELVWNSLV